jgi:uncharacterized protein YuzB (UPF0349 family)
MTEKPYVDQVHVRWCANNFLRHRPDEAVQRWMQLGAQVEITGCLAQCQHCRVEACCLIDGEVAVNLTEAEKRMKERLIGR